MIRVVVLLIEHDEGCLIAEVVVERDRLLGLIHLQPVVVVCLCTSLKDLQELLQVLQSSAGPG